MANQQLIDYIRQRLQENIPREAINSNLISQGWQQPDINEAFLQVNTPTPMTQMNASNTNLDETKSNGKATAGLVLGIIGLIAWVIPLIGAPVTITGLVLSIKSIKSINRKVAIAGVVLCSIGLLATIINASIGAYMGATGRSPLVNQLLNQGTQKPEMGVGEASKQQEEPLGTENTLKSEIINSAVRDVKSQMPLPYQVDQFTTMVDVTAEPSAIRYYYILSDLTDTSGMTSIALKGILAPTACNTPETRDLLRQGINLEYSYSVENSPQTFFIKITEKDCG